MLPKILCFAALISLTPTFAFAQKPPALTPAETKVVANSLDIVRGCQLPNGAFNMVDDGKQPGSPVWIPPYFANYGALALAVNAEKNRNAGDLKRVEVWLNWCVKNQDSQGFFYDQHGTIAKHDASKKFVDAWDSSAAMFLVVVERYQRAGGKVTPGMESACKKALACIEQVTIKGGLTIAKPTYPVMYLMDNIETRAGLNAASAIFTKLKDAKTAKAAAEQATAITALLTKYHDAAKGEFAWAKHPSGVYERGMEKLYPNGLAQLFGIMSIQPDAKAWQATTKAFKPEVNQLGAGAERFYLAAIKIGGADAKIWRANTIADAATFTNKNVYIHRPALVALAFLDGADWLP